jgi:hypothetical protein
MTTLLGIAAVTVALWEVSSLLPAGCTPPLKVALVLTLVASIRPHLDLGRIYVWLHYGKAVKKTAAFIADVTKSVKLFSLLTDFLIYMNIELRFAHGTRSIHTKKFRST